MTPVTWIATADGARSACGLFGVYLIPEGYVGIVTWFAGDRDFSPAYLTFAEALAWCENKLKPTEAV